VWSRRDWLVYVAAPLGVGLTIALFVWLLTRSSAGSHEAQRPSVPGAGPIIFTVRDDVGAYNDGYALVATPNIAEKITSDSPNCRVLLQHARGEDPDATHISPLYLRILAQGNTPKGATIVGMHAHIENTGTKLEGAVLECPGGGEVIPTGLLFNLDRPDAEAIALRDGRPEGSYFGKGYAIALSKGEKHAFAITAETRASYFEWTIAVDIVVNGKPETRTIDYHGAPFRITAARCGAAAYAPSYTWPLVRGAGVVRHPSRTWYCG
jgi:hypothetical protein